MSYSPEKLIQRTQIYGPLNAPAEVPELVFDDFVDMICEARTNGNRKALESILQQIRFAVMCNGSSMSGRPRQGWRRLTELRPFAHSALRLLDAKQQATTNEPDPRFQALVEGLRLQEDWPDLVSIEERAQALLDCLRNGVNPRPPPPDFPS